MGAINYAEIVSDVMSDRPADLDRVLDSSCLHANCLHGGVVDPAAKYNVVRITLGYARYGVHEYVFTRNDFEFGSEYTERFAHQVCASDAGVDVHSMTMAECTLCPGSPKQYYGEIEPKETLVILELGDHDEYGVFHPDIRRAVHWACAMREWDAEFTEDLKYARAI